MTGCSVKKPQQQRRMSVAVIFAATLAIALTMMATGLMAATSGMLDCVLTNPGSQANNQPIVVTFNDTDKTLAAQRGTKNYSFTNVSISNISISGQTNSVSLGIDRSSLGIVWQQYAADKVVTEFGQCRAGDHPNSADSH
jgi:hypothetical protein